MRTYGYPPGARRRHGAPRRHCRREAQITTAQQSAIRGSCRSDFMSHCSGVTPGGKDALTCLQKNVGSSVRRLPVGRARDHAGAGCRQGGKARAAHGTRHSAARAGSRANAASPTSRRHGRPLLPRLQLRPPPCRLGTAAEGQDGRSCAAACRHAARTCGTARPSPLRRRRPAARRSEQLKALKFTCRGDFKRLCKHVPEGPEAFACLQSHAAELSADRETSVRGARESIPAGGAMPAAGRVAVKPGAGAAQPEGALVDAAVVIRACKLDVHPALPRRRCRRRQVARLPDRARGRPDVPLPHGDEGVEPAALSGRAGLGRLT